MKILLDSSILIHLLTEPEKLPESILSECKKLSNDLYISGVTLWEIQMKTRLAKVQFNLPLKQVIEEQIDSGQFKFLDLTLEHIKGSEDLPFHHNDPFDRMLISQAIKENLVIATENKQFAFYGELFELLDF